MRLAVRLPSREKSVRNGLSAGGNVIGAPDGARSKWLAGLAHALTDLADFPAGELGERARLGLEGARQVVTVARGGIADRRSGIGMPQHVAALEILPIGGFLQHQILGEMVTIVT